MNFIRLTAFIAVSMTFFACEQNKEAKYSSAEIPADQKEIAVKTITDEKSEFEQGFGSDSISRQKLPGDKEQQQQPGQPPVKQDWDKKIIKTASLNIETKDYNAYSISLRKKIRDLGGYVAQEDQSQSGYKIENMITIKVPVDQFDNAVVDITAGAEKIHQKKISSNDVTAEVIDTRSRMEAKKQVRLRYIDLLKQAKNMEDILHVQVQINGIQEEIESAAGRIQYLGHSAVFSTIQLTYYQILNSAAKEADKPNAGQQLRDAFATGWIWMRDLCIALVSVWPLFLIALTIYFFYKRSKLNKTKQTA